MTMTTKDDVRDVSDLMTGDLVALRPGDRAARALDILLQSGLHALPVIQAEGKGIGMITTADLVHADPDAALADLLTGPPITVKKTATIAEAASVMRSQYVHHLLVTEGSDTIGILSSYDLLFMLEDSP